MKFTMKIAMDNAAFNEDNTELSRIIRKAADYWERYTPEPGDSFRLLDVNGNHVGEARIIK